MKRRGFLRDLGVAMAAVALVRYAPKAEEVVTVGRGGAVLDNWDIEFGTGQLYVGGVHIGETTLYSAQKPIEWKTKAVSFEGDMEWTTCS